MSSSAPGKLTPLPREPTEAMREAGTLRYSISTEMASGVWRAMVAAYEANTTPALLEGRRPAVGVALEIAIAALGQIGDRKGQYHKACAARARIALRKISALVPHLAADR